MKSFIISITALIILFASCNKDNGTANRPTGLLNDSLLGHWNLCYDKRHVIDSSSVPTMNVLMDTTYLSPVFSMAFYADTTCTCPDPFNKYEILPDHKIVLAWVEPHLDTFHYSISSNSDTLILIRQRNRALYIDTLLHKFNRIP
jgi:hypothetical protein